MKKPKKYISQLEKIDKTNRRNIIIIEAINKHSPNITELLKIINKDYSDKKISRTGLNYYIKSLLKKDLIYYKKLGQNKILKVNKKQINRNNKALEKNLKSYYKEKLDYTLLKESNKNFIIEDKKIREDYQKSEDKDQFFYNLHILKTQGFVKLETKISLTKKGIKELKKLNTKS